VYGFLLLFEHYLVFTGVLQDGYQFSSNVVNFITNIFHSFF